MNTPQERRSQKRLPVSIPAILHSDKDQEKIEVEIVDISEGGAFIKCTKNIPVGKELRIEIKFGETKVLQAKVIEKDVSLAKDVPVRGLEKSVIRWKVSEEKDTKEQGFGVQFLELHTERQAFLKKLFRYFENLARAGVQF